MSFPTFQKGAHPPHRKSATEFRPIETVLPTRDLVYPMSQHIGAPCTPLVKKGDRVLAGQKIGDTEAFVAAPVICSVSGTVKEVGPHPTIPGTNDICVTVENDNLYESVPFVQTLDYLHLDPDDCRRRIRAAGIVGMGGASFPAAVKLTPPPGRVIKHIIINGSECEPYLTCDDRIMTEHPEEIVEGLRILLHMFSGAKGYIAIEDNKPEAIETMSTVSHNLPHISVVPVKSKYPQGAEKMLIYALTGQEVPCGALPADVGCIMLNAGTVARIWEAIALGRPIMERVITVTGDAIATPKNLLVKIGTSVMDLIDACGGFATEPAKVLSGGPLMGTAMSSLEVPVVKGTSGILALSPEAAYVAPEQACIRCGKCVEVCPMNLLPFAINAQIVKRDYDAFEEKGGMNCIECGCCTYACPARRYLTQSCRDGKRTVTARRRKG